MEASWSLNCVCSSLMLVWLTSEKVLVLRGPRASSVTPTGHTDRTPGESTRPRREQGWTEVTPHGPA